MSDKLDTSAAAALDKLSSGAEAVVAKLGTMAEKYGPEVVDSALWVVRVNGLSEIATASLGVAIGVGVPLLFWRRLIAWTATHNEHEPLNWFPIAIGAPAFAIVTIVNVVNLANVWSWVAVIEPKLWVAKKLLGI